ncbi:MAG: oxidoreductase [Clostridia bacterium]|jgi:2-dehydropantoate 2-reductase|nr:oxidoreductase [Clostridia bacterium]
MKYVIIGAGGTGGNIGAFLQAAEKDTTFIARGQHLAVMQEKGLKINSFLKGKMFLENLKAYDMESYSEKADVIFVCVKGYSIEETVSFIKKASHENTLVIPILNIFGTGDHLAAQLEEIKVLDGCIYIVGYISAPGEIVQDGHIFRIVFGPRAEQPIEKELLQTVERDLIESGIDVVVSDNIKRDTFQKFSFISSYAATGAYYDVTAQEIQRPGACRDTFILLVKEIESIAAAMGISFNFNVVDKNLAIVDALIPETTASMQKDIIKGGNAEIDGLIFEVVRLAAQYGIKAPEHYKIAKHFGFEA